LALPIPLRRGWRDRYAWGRCIRWHLEMTREKSTVRLTKFFEPRRRGSHVNDLEKLGILVSPQLFEPIWGIAKINCLH